MLKSVFTLDYEIHGNGEGDPYPLMVEPTRRMMNLFEHFGAKLTIMADVAEILKFQQYRKDSDRDAYHYQAITEQLCDAVRRGHDVQLHLHASYFNANHRNGKWLQDWSEYDFARLSHERLCEIVGIGKTFLEHLLRPVLPTYECIAFRAANWSMCPSRNAVRALLANGLRIDTSVFKHGQRSGLVTFDYTTAHSELVPWRVQENNICNMDEKGSLLEIPIYSENRWIGAFLTPQRIYRAFVSRLHGFSSKKGDGPDKAVVNKKATVVSSTQTSGLRRLHAWKADFNQCTGRQLIAAVERAYANHGGVANDLPFVLIGHSKLFTRFNEWSLRPFLSYVATHCDRFGFSRLSEFDPLTNTDYSDRKNQSINHDLSEVTTPVRP